MNDGPFHPREPSPLEVAVVVLNPCNWACVAMAFSVWAPGAALRAWRRFSEDAGL